MPASLTCPMPPACARRRRLLLAAACAPLAACATRAAPPALSVDALVQAMAAHPVVLLGEVHDNPVQHRARLEALERRIAQGMRPAIAFEQFDRGQQAAIDAIVADGTDADARAARIVDRLGARGWDWPLYRPFLQLALRHRLPIVAANLSRADATRVARGAGFEAVLDREALARLAPDRLPPDVMRAHERAVDDGHCNAMPAASLPPLARAQIARDAVLYESIRPYLARELVLLTGNGHARNDIGVPRFMRADERARTVTIGLIEAPADGESLPASWPARFDAAFITPRHTRPDPCEAFRRSRKAG